MSTATRPRPAKKRDSRTIKAYFDDGYSPWIVDSKDEHVGAVMYWARKPMGPKRS